MAAAPPAEVLHLQEYAARRKRARAVTVLKGLRNKLAKDPIALGTIDCIERGQTEPADQARALGVPVEEIYAARKRRKRALEAILEETPEDDEEKT